MNNPPPCVPPATSALGPGSPDEQPGESRLPANEGVVAPARPSPPSNLRFFDEVTGMVAHVAGAVGRFSFFTRTSMKAGRNIPNIANGAAIGLVAAGPMP